jgi:hypothetical protein
MLRSGPQQASRAETQQSQAVAPPTHKNQAYLPEIEQHLHPGSKSVSNASYGFFIEAFNIQVRSEL